MRYFVGPVLLYHAISCSVFSVNSFSYQLVKFLLCVVSQVSEEVGLTSNEDDVDFELEGDITVDVNLPSEMSAAECTVADEEVNNISIPTASNLDCQDTYTVTDPGSSDQQSHKETAAAANEADCQNNEYLSEMCPDSRDTNCNPQLVKSIPGKAIPVSFYGASAEQPVILDKTSKDLMSDPQDLLKVQSESEDLASSAVPVADCYAAAKKSENSQQSKKHKSVSMTVCDLKYGHRYIVGEYECADPVTV